jgi:hypothetical protein
MSKVVHKMAMLYDTVKVLKPLLGTHLKGYDLIPNTIYFGRHTLQANNLKNPLCNRNFRCQPKNRCGHGHYYSALMNFTAKGLWIKSCEGH